MKLLLIGLLVFSMNAIAGERGNGGHGIFCEGKKPVIIDYYEASLKRYGSVPVLLPEMDVESLTAAVEKRLSNFPYFLKTFKDAKSKLGPIENWIYADQLPLRQINDSNEAYVFPSSCKKIQLAVRQGSDIFLSEPNFELLSEGQKSILWLHEVIYFIAESYGKETSRETRQLIRELIVRDTNSGRLSQKIAELGANNTSLEDLDVSLRLNTAKTKSGEIVRDAIFDLTKDSNLLNPNSQVFREIFFKADDGRIHFLASIDNKFVSYTVGMSFFKKVSISQDEYKSLVSTVWPRFLKVLSDRLFQTTGCSLQGTPKFLINPWDLKDAVESSILKECIN